MDRPAFQFYPGDWLGNANLRRCSYAQKGIWLEVLCLMHEQPEYGILRWPLIEIIDAVKCKPTEMRALVTRGIMKGSDSMIDQPYIYRAKTGRRIGPPIVLISAQRGPLWFSSRMIRDEYVRLHRGEGTRFGDDSNGNAPKYAPTRAPKGSPNSTLNGSPNGPPSHAPNPPFGEPLSDGSSSSSSSSTTGRETTSPSLSRSPAPTREGAGASAGEACKAMRQAGIGETNPDNPDLISMLSQGMTVGELEAAAKTAIDSHAAKPFAYALSVARSERERAASRGPLPEASKTHGIARFMRPPGTPSVLDMTPEEREAHYGADAAQARN